MKVGELMTSTVITASPDTAILDARQLMLKERIRHLLVTEADGSLVGIVTDRDIRLNLPSQATSLSVWEINHLLTKLTVGEVMTRTMITIGPDSESHEATATGHDLRRCSGRDDAGPPASHTNPRMMSVSVMMPISRPRSVTGRAPIE